MSDQPLSSDEFDDAQFFHPLGASDCLRRIERWRSEAVRRESALRTLVSAISRDEAGFAGAPSRTDVIDHAIAAATMATGPIDVLPEGDRGVRGRTPYALPAYYHDWAEALESALSGLIAAAPMFEAALAAAEDALHPSSTDSGAYISDPDWRTGASR